MKKFKYYAILLLVAVMALTTSCGEDYDDTGLKNDINDLKSRVEKLETWCTTVNGQISALQGLVTALEAKDYVTGVSPVENGYTITFSKSGAITIYNGKDGANGATPIIGAAKDTDGLYYWTIKVGDTDADWMKDADGNKIRTTGDAGKTPEISVATDTDGKVYWQVNGKWLEDAAGNKVQATGDTGDKGDTGASGSAGAAGKDGDSIFKKDGIDLTDPNSVTFTLNDGKDTKITLPRTSAMTIFDSFNEFKVAENDVAANLTLKLNIKDADYAAIKAELISSAGMTVAIKTRAGGTPWEVAITAPAFEAGEIKTQPEVSITPKGAVNKDFALLKITVIDKKGQEHAATRMVVFDDQVAATSVKITDADKGLSVAEGSTGTLVAEVLPANASNKSVTWKSDDESIATVDATGKVTGVAKGETTITVTTADGGFTATCKVEVVDKLYIEVNGTKWAIGNLVADGAKGAKIGAATDNNLFFQFGSIVGWSPSGSTPTIAIKPEDCTVADIWTDSWTGDVNTDNAVAGTGDPCRYYLGETWRQPTKTDIEELFKNSGDWERTGDWTEGSGSYIVHKSGLKFVAAGAIKGNGSLFGVGLYGYAWGTTAEGINWYNMIITKTGSGCGSTSPYYGMTARCVRD